MYWPGGALFSSIGKCSSPYGVPNVWYTPSGVKTSSQWSSSLRADNIM